ncbi:MAG TPA: GvpL/GvpF family gas vesicle protein [Thermoanaerobaculia bacterium]|nr:GvpL/GvpF family gas vesicle protein [Thermoanaerobaculia bacterium]
MARADKTEARKKPAGKKAAPAAKTAKTAKKATAAPPAGKKAAAQKAAPKPAGKKAPAAKKARKPAASPRGRETAREPAREQEPRSANGTLSDLLAFPEASARPGGRSGKYVYCIIHTNDPCRFGPIGIGSEPAEVHTVNYKDIAAVVSDTPLEVYDPTRENVLAHERVNEVVMRDFTVIPMSFSTVFKTSEDIVELLRSAYDAFRDVLVKMQDKLEFGLKVLWEPETIIREIEKDDENLRLLRQEISHQKGSTYFARMQYGRLVDSLLQETSEKLVSEIIDTLSSVCVASRTNKPIGDKMILNGAFLVARDREPDFDAKVKEIDARYENLIFKYTGPWPPYNFVNIRLKLERASEAE